MATMAFNFKIAIFLALAHFGSTSSEIYVDFVDPEGKRIQTLRIHPIDGERGAFNLLYESNGEWVANAQLSVVDAEKHIYRFGRPGEGQPVELKKAIKDLDRVLDRGVKDFEFEAVFKEKNARFRISHSADTVLLLDTDAKKVFILHASPKGP